MDLFIENLDKIRRVVEFIVRRYNFQYEVDELINASYIGYCRAVKNNPSSVYTKFNNTHTLLKRVKYDILDYIREEVKGKSKKNMENAGMVVPKMFNATFLPISDDNKEDTHYVPVEEEGYEDIDNRDTLDYLMNNSGLTDKEKKVIYIRYAKGETIEETAGIMGVSCSGVNYLQKAAVGKIKDKVEWSCVEI